MFTLTFRFFGIITQYITPTPLPIPNKHLFGMEVIINDLVRASPGKNILFYF